MLLVLVTCAGILTRSPGCKVHRIPVVADFIPTGCAARVQELVAERVDLLNAGRVVRYGCERRRRQEADAGSGQ